MEWRWGCRVVCRTVAAALAMAGVAGGWLALGTGGALLLVGIIAALVTFGCWRLRPSPVQPGPTGAQIVHGLIAGIGVLAVTGLIAELGPAGWWLTVFVAAVGWGMPRRPARRHADLARRRPPDRGRLVPTGGPALEMLPADPLPQPSKLPSVSTPRLCWAWRVSYVRIRRCTWPSELAQLAALRNAYLDELQHRDPAAFARWYPTARAASDPARFFCPRPAAWPPACRADDAAISSVPPQPRPQGTTRPCPEDADRPPTHVNHSTEGQRTDGRAARRHPAPAHAGAPAAPPTRPAPVAPETQLHERKNVDDKSDQSSPGRQRG